MGEDFEIVFLGTTGSCAFNSGKRIKYGTNTLCTTVRVGGNILIFDAGSGICGFNHVEGFQKNELHLFLSHYHEDHMSGLIFWNAMFDKEKIINIYGTQSGYGDLSETLTAYVKPPLYPITVDTFGAKVNYHTIQTTQKIELEDDVIVDTIGLNHPGGCTGYRISYHGKSVCYFTDVEVSKQTNDQDLMAIAENTDLLIMDSFFRDGEVIESWGHSSPQECAEFAKRVHAKRLALYHYHFSAEDEDIIKLEKAAQLIFKQTFASADGMRVEI